jgi:hypothetical protein
MGAKVRVSGGNVIVTDGPFAETKELIGGFAIVEAGTVEEAIAIARGFWIIPSVKKFLDRRSSFPFSLSTTIASFLLPLCCSVPRQLLARGVAITA